jgi:hypothetical protein
MCPLRQQRKRQFERNRCRWEENIKMDLRETDGLKYGLMASFH